jgi:hypothetical protein
MRKCLLIIIAIVFFFASCSKYEEKPASKLTEYDMEVIHYFKEIALGFEFGSASEITRKWIAEMKIYVGGEITTELEDELKRIISEINILSTDGFIMEIIQDSAKANFYIYLGSGEEYAEIYPSQSDYIQSNWGLFSVYWKNQSHLVSGHMYVDIYRADKTAQKHLLREELTQSLGLAKDSYLYSESIFQAEWTTTTKYAKIDRDLIRLLYHPDMETGLNAGQIEDVLTDILVAEK